MRKYRIPLDVAKKRGLKPIRARAEFDYDDINHNTHIMSRLEVTDELFPTLMRSSLLDPDGDPIEYAVESPALGYAGFVKPSWADDNDMPYEDEEDGA
jgi:hypothetical protein